MLRNPRMNTSVRSHRTGFSYNVIRHRKMHGAFTSHFVMRFKVNKLNISRSELLEVFAQQFPSEKDKVFYNNYEDVNSK